MLKIFTPVPGLGIRRCIMAFERIAWTIRKPTYLFVWLVTALLVGWVYVGPLTDQEAYDGVGWIFAAAFPILVGAMVAVQIANYRERKACPINAASGGLGGA